MTGDPAPSLPLVGQVLVSDPGGPSSGGYALLASSPAAAAEDLDFLQRSPGASEQLHTGSAPGPYHSFHALPSGRWALTLRFLRGRRRGDFHRVVAYTLVIPTPVLLRLDVQPWLLIAEPCLRPDAAAVPLDVTALAEAALTAPPASILPDLELIPPPDARSQAIGLLIRDRDRLVAQWGRDVLADWLARVLTALAAGHRVLLPQGAEPLLALAWAALPATDRLESPWTTHFAPGVAVLFRLANAPDEGEARAMHQRPEEWLAVATESPHASPPLAAAAERWTRQILADPVQLGERLAAVDRHRLSLLHAPLDLGRWLGWLDSSSHLLAAGFPDLGQLGDFLRGAFPSGDRSRSPWLADGHLLALGGATLRALLSSAWSRRKTFGLAAGAVAAALVESGARPGAAAVNAAWAALRGAAGLPGWEVALAVHAVALHTQPEGEQKDGLRAATLALLEEQPAAATGVRHILELQGQLALELTRSGSPAGIEALGGLSRRADGLAVLAGLLRPGDEDPGAVRVILEESRRGVVEPIEPAWVDILETVAGRAPLLVAGLAASDLAQALAVRRTGDLSPLLEAAIEWEGAAQEAAFDEFGRWLAAGHPQARTVLDALLANDRLEALVPTPALARLCLRALEHAPPQTDRLRFALVGARALDRAVPATATGSFAQHLRAWILTPPDAIAALARALTSCRRDVVPRHQHLSSACTELVLRHLCDQAAEDPCEGFQAETMLVAVEMGSGHLDLVGALHRLRRRATELGGTQERGDEWLAAATSQLLPASPAERVCQILDLLRAEHVPPSLKEFLERRLLAATLTPLDPQLAACLADLATGTVDGGLRLAAARQLGAAWPASAAAAARFLHQALAQGRVDAAVALLHRASATVTPKAPSTLLAALAPPLRAQLSGALTAALSRPASWQLTAYLPPPRRPWLRRSRTRP